MSREILSLLCLPISPPGRLIDYIGIPIRKRESALRFPFVFWSGRRVSNSRPQPWQGCALPTELLPQNSWRREPESNRPTRICNPVHNRFAIAPSLQIMRYNQKEHDVSFCKTGAAEESRTLDLNLGKVALYQLSYCRVKQSAHYRRPNGFVNITYGFSALRLTISGQAIRR